MLEYRNKEQLLSEFYDTSDLWKKIQIATEWYIGEKNNWSDDFEYLWRQLPSKTKYLSMIVKYYKKFGLLHAVNPAMSGMGGFIGLSKSETNKHIPHSLRPKSILVYSENGLKQILTYMRQQGLSFPVMIKPDACEQSYGVKHLGDDIALSKYLENSLPKLIIEEYISTNTEYGIFIQKLVSNGVIDDQFTITSLVEKQKPFVVGDGIRTVYSLIQDLDFTQDIFERIVGGLTDLEIGTILENGKRMNVVRTATSYFGVSQHDLYDQISKKLTDRMNEILLGYDGFYFGRFDILADSLEDIEKGNFRVVELNGASGIPLHIYAPNQSVVRRHEIMTTHFDQMMSLATANKEKYNMEKYSIAKMAIYFTSTVSKQKLPGSTYKFWKVTMSILRNVIKLRFKIF